MTLHGENISPRGHPEEASVFTQIRAWKESSQEMLKAGVSRYFGWLPPSMLAPILGEKALQKGSASTKMPSVTPLLKPSDVEHPVATGRNFMGGWALWTQDKQYIRTWAAVIWVFACSGIMSAGNEIAYRRRPMVALLPDVLFDTFESFGEEHASLSDYLLTVHVVLILTLVTFSAQRQRMLRRFCTVYGTVFLVRGATVLLTNLPDPSPRCVAKDELHTRPHLAFIALRGIFPVGVITCGDMIFSGHTVSMVMMALTCRYYIHTCTLLPKGISKDVSRRWATWFFLCFTGFSLFCTVVSRLHYTVDVVIGIYLTTMFWYIYHLIALVPPVRKRVAIVAWLEDGCEEQLSWAKVVEVASIKESPACTPVLTPIALGVHPHGVAQVSAGGAHAVAVADRIITRSDTEVWVHAGAGRRRSPHASDLNDDTCSESSQNSETGIGDQKVHGSMASMAELDN